jgi:peptidoglycan/xylan/chitin deacetylase (PgdA/CDA1 family)
VAHHGYGHEDPSSQSPDEERRSLEWGLAVLERFLDGPPLGYRSPSWDYSTATLPLLVEYGFLYDSSLFAEDFQPYHPRLGDQVGVAEPLRVGQEVDLWEFPVDFSLDDWPHFTFNFDPLRVGLSAPSKVFEIWADDYDYMVEHEEGGVLTVTMHPQVIGRGHRMALLERFVEHVLASGKARFARMGDVAKELSGGYGKLEGLG